MGLSVHELELGVVLRASKHGQRLPREHELWKLQARVLFEIDAQMVLQET